MAIIIAYVSPKNGRITINDTYKDLYTLDVISATENKPMRVVILDKENRDKIIEDVHAFSKHICERRFGIGADGVLLLENSEKADFKMRIINADSTEAEMCGNGARCAARFAYINKIAGSEMSFETDAGIVSAQVKNGLVKVKLTDSKKCIFVLNDKTGYKYGNYP